MKRPWLTIATAACLGAGWWLPGLWQKESPGSRLRIVAPPPEQPRAAVTPASFEAVVHGAGGIVAQFQAVVDTFGEQGTSAAFLKDGFSGLSCREAEELATALAGEELAQRAGKDGKAFRRSLQDVNKDVATAAFVAWSERYPERALELFISPAGKLYYDDTIRAMAARDPAKMLDMLHRIPSGHTLPTAWSEALTALAGKDPAAGLTALLAAPWPVRRDSGKEMLAAIARKDPAAAMAWLEKLPKELKQSEYKPAVWSELAKTDPLATATQALESDPETFASGGSDIAKQWAQKDAEAAFAWGLNNPKHLPGDWHEICLSTLARRDPLQAVSLLEQLGKDEQESVSHEIAGAWPPSGFSDALLWADGLDKEQRPQALNRLTATARELPEEQRRALADAAGSGTMTGLRMLLTLDRDEALSAFKKLPPDMTGSAFQLVQSASGNSAELTAPFLSSALANSAGKDFVSESSKMVAGWAGRDPQAAAAWVDSLPPGEAQKMAAVSLAINWGRHDPKAAAAWVDRLPEGPARKLVKERLASISGK